MAIESFWTRLFSQYFVCNEDDTRDDLLFYVKGKSQDHDAKVTREAEVCMKLVESQKLLLNFERIVVGSHNFEEGLMLQAAAL